MSVCIFVGTYISVHITIFFKLGVFESRLCFTEETAGETTAPEAWVRYTLAFVMYCISSRGIIWGRAYRSLRESSSPRSRWTIHFAVGRRGIRILGHPFFLIFGFWWLV